MDEASRQSEYKTRHWMWLILLILVTWAFLLIQLNEPWLGLHDGNGAWISAAVYNYHKFGAIDVHFLIPSGYAPSELDNLTYYLHHPPLVVWLSVVASYLFGTYDTGFPLEMSQRMVSLYATVLSLAAFYLLCRRLFGKRYALVTLFLYAATPMIWYYGRMPNHEPLALIFLYLFGAVFVDWMQDFTRTQTLILAILAVLAMWTMWAPAFYLAALGIVALRWGSFRHRTAIVGIGVVTVIMTAFILIFYEVQAPGAFADLMEAFSYRTSNASAEPGTAPFTLGEFVLRTFVHLITAVSIGLSTLGIYGIFYLARRKVSLQIAVIWAFIAAGLAYALVFRNAFNWHDYYKVMWMPGLAMSAGQVVLYWWDLRQRGWARFARPFVIAIIIVSLVLGLAWFTVLQLSGHQVESVLMAQDINTLTEPNALILSPETAHTGSEYYSHRQWLWQADIDEVLSHDYPFHAYLVLCHAPIGSVDFDEYEHIWQEYPTQPIADGLCRLVTL